MQEFEAMLTVGGFARGALRALPFAAYLATCAIPSRARAETQAAQLWSPQGPLLLTDAAAYDHFGGAVAVSGDTLVVGAPGRSVNGHISSGAVYSFKRNGPAWSPDGPALTLDYDADYQYFGTAIALSGDTMVLGVPARILGEVVTAESLRVYTRTELGWTPLGTPLTPSDPAFQAFGHSIAISGDTMIVGAHYKTVGNNRGQGAAYIFERHGQIWSQQGPPLTASTGSADDHFGCAVAIANDTLVIGADGRNTDIYAEGGAAYVFVRHGTVWDEQAVLTDLGPPPEKRFGASVAIAGDTIAVGSHVTPPATGPVAAATVFNRIGNTWSRQTPAVHMLDRKGTVSSHYATTVVLSEDGNTLAIGTDEAKTELTANGAGYIFARVGGEWRQQGPALRSMRTGSANFGQAVALSGHTVVFGSGETPIAGSDGQGAAYVYAVSPCAADTDCPGAGYCAEGLCRIRCQQDSDCTKGSFCPPDGRCQPQKAQGSHCNQGAGGDCFAAGCSVCVTGNCVDGVCCDSACGGTCQACAAALTAESDGICAPIPADQDPRGDCASDRGYPASCLADGSCDGHGACRAFAKSGTACGETTCVEGAVTGAICDGTGQCIVDRAPCAPYVCDGASCSAECASDADCDAGSGYCLMSACARTKQIAAACSGNNECGSGFCSDGVCCESLCDGQCEACAEPGKQGQCVPVADVPRGARPGCDAAGCEGACDGIHRDRCASCSGACTSDGDCAMGQACVEGACGSKSNAGDAGSAGRPGIAGDAGQSGIAGGSGRAGVAGDAGQPGVAGDAGQSGDAGCVGGMAAQRTLRCHPPTDSESVSCGCRLGRTPPTKPVGLIALVLTGLLLRRRIGRRTLAH